jgi:hypothetical protein
MTGINQTASGVFAGLGREMPAQLSLLMSITLFWAIGWWLRDDLRKRNKTLVYCLGMFLWIAWPILLPYYLIKTRGRKAFFTMALFVGISVVGAVLGVILAIFFS